MLFLLLLLFFFCRCWRLCQQLQTNGECWRRCALAGSRSINYETCHLHVSYDRQTTHRDIHTRTCAMHFAMFVLSRVRKKYWPKRLLLWLIPFFLLLQIFRTWRQRRQKEQTWCLAASGVWFFVSSCVDLQRRADRQK